MKRITAVVHLTSVVMLLTMTGVIFLQVIMRNFFNFGFVWVEEFSRFLLVCTILITSPVLVLSGAHVRFDLLMKRESPKVRAIHRIVILVGIIFFYGVYIVSHQILMSNNGNVLSPSLGLPNKYFFGAGLIGAVMGVVFGIVKIVELVKGDNR